MRKIILLCISMMAYILSSTAQERPIPANTMVSETVLFQRDYPRIDREHRAYFRLYAPQAKKVTLELQGTHDMERDDDGWWYAVINPLVVGPHFYHFMVDGICVTDINTDTYCGSYGRSSMIEIPEGVHKSGLQQRRHLLSFLDGESGVLGIALRIFRFRRESGCFPAAQLAAHGFCRAHTCHGPSACRRGRQHRRVCHHAPGLVHLRA